MEGAVAADPAPSFALHGRGTLANLNRAGAASLAVPSECLEIVVTRR